MAKNKTRSIRLRMATVIKKISQLQKMNADLLPASAEKFKEEMVNALDTSNGQFVMDFYNESKV